MNCMIHLKTQIALSDFDLKEAKTCKNPAFWSTQYSALIIELHNVRW
jgi:hypothetical protein